nr:hypothetical protein [uncultured bacterium]
MTTTRSEGDLRLHLLKIVESGLLAAPGPDPAPAVAALLEAGLVETGGHPPQGPRRLRLTPAGRDDLRRRQEGLVRNGAGSWDALQRFISDLLGELRGGDAAPAGGADPISHYTERLVGFLEGPARRAEARDPLTGRPDPVLSGPVGRILRHTRLDAADRDQLAAVLTDLLHQARLGVTPVRPRP